MDIAGAVGNDGLPLLDSSRLPDPAQRPDQRPRYKASSVLLGDKESGDEPSFSGCQPEDALVPIRQVAERLPVFVLGKQEGVVPGRERPHEQRHRVEFLGPQAERVVVLGVDLGGFRTRRSPRKPDELGQDLEVRTIGHHHANAHVDLIPETTVMPMT